MKDTNSKEYPVVFEQVSHAYDGRFVLHHISLTFEENHITVILGNSGGGKSTLLQMINGLIIPTKGKISIFGSPINYHQIHLFRRKIGYVVQGTGLFPHLTTQENIAILARISNYDKQKTEQRIRFLMQLVDLSPDYIKKYPHQLSGGEQQRVGICRAMMLNPTIFLLDEPFAALDQLTRHEIHRELLNLQKEEPRTIIMVTHDVNEALKLADSIIVLDHGKVQQIGTPDEIINDPVNTTVKKLFDKRNRQ